MCTNKTHTNHASSLRKMPGNFCPLPRLRAAYLQTVSKPCCALVAMCLTQASGKSQTHNRRRRHSQEPSLSPPSLSHSPTHPLTLTPKPLKRVRSLSLEKVARAGDAAVEQPPLVSARLAHRHHLRSRQALAAHVLLCNDCTVFRARDRREQRWARRKNHQRRAGGRAGGHRSAKKKRSHSRQETTRTAPQHLLFYLPIPNPF